MGISAGIALLVLGYSLYFQASSRQLIHLDTLRYETNVRMTTTYAMAALLIAVGFFLAGVPIGTEQLQQTSNTATPIPTQVAILATAAPTVTSTPRPKLPTVEPESVITPTESAETPATTPLPAEAETAEPTSVIPSTETPTQTSIPSPSPTMTATPLPTTTPSPTPTPLPTLKPTPIEESAATVDTGGSTLWIRRTPGGTNIFLLQNGDTVILKSGNASHEGRIWKEVMSLDGVAGWVPREYLKFP